ncbi:MAG: hypothetical protein H6868_09120 [Rhodospirillales bacterium]|nr:hypothetical protein [Rhodospirillales bacterium]
MWEQLFVFLYPVVAIITIIAYVPQIKTLITATSIPNNISLSSWLMWCCSNFLAFGYAMTHVQDMLLALVTGMNLLMVITTTALIAYNRYIRFAEKPFLTGGMQLQPQPVKIRKQ